MFLGLMLCNTADFLRNIILLIYITEAAILWFISYNKKLLDCFDRRITILFKRCMNNEELTRYSNILCGINITVYKHVNIK